jgi:choline dehydrogenase-like flavoprotein
MDTLTEADYIIVGGGLTGCALASRLAKLLSPQSILLLEAGPHPSSNPYTTTPLGGFALQGSELDWAYPTAPIPSTSNRVITLAAGKTLGGGSVLSI